MSYEGIETTAGRIGYAVATERAPHRHIGMDAGHGYVYWSTTEQAFVLEHCVDGRWGGCRVGRAGATDRTLMLACLGHLERSRARGAAHRTRVPQHLAGVVHAPWPWKR
ncbi:MAG: hypothetical protein ACRDXE_04875 [Acidimicrobiales bacterium]